YSRLVAPPGDSVAEQPSEIFVVHRDNLTALIAECPELTSILVHVMLDRARAFTSSDLQAEKMVSLGKLSAGLAHDVNNPAAAIASSSKSLRDAMTESEDSSRALGSLGLTGAQLSGLNGLRHECLDVVSTVVRSPLQQADREAEIADWLRAHGAAP